MQKPLLIVVDDEPDVAEIVAFAADAVGFAVRTVTNAEAFKQVWAETDPVVAVMDIVMPDGDGMELLRWLADRGCRAPVVLMSGYDSSYLIPAEHFATGRGLSVAAALAKPLRLANLEAVLRQIMPSLPESSA